MIFFVRWVICVTSRPGKKGGSWDPRSKKIFGLQESFQPKSRTFVENQVFVANPALLELWGKKYQKPQIIYWKELCLQNFLGKGFLYKIFFERALYTKFSLKGRSIQNFLWNGFKYKIFFERALHEKKFWKGIEYKKFF